MTDDKMKDNNASAAQKVEDLYKLIEGIDIAMFTTRRPDGHLVSRPMSTQRQTAGSDLWFVTDITTNKLDEIVTDPHVNLAYYNMKSREYVSVAGTATISQDRNIIRDLWQPDWKAWFGDEGGEKDGSADDPRIALVLVKAHSVQYLVVNSSRPMIYFEVAKALMTGSTPDIGEERTLTERELRIPTQDLRT